MKAFSNSGDCWLNSLKSFMWQPTVNPAETTHLLDIYCGRFCTLPSGKRFDTFVSLEISSYNNRTDRNDSGDICRKHSN